VHHQSAGANRWIIKETQGAQPCPVEDLVGNDDLSGLVLRLQTATSADRNEVLDAEHLEAEDVSSTIELSGTDPVPAPMTRQEGHAYVVDLADDVDIGRGSEGRVKPDLLHMS
jgi:hypothetical protein